MSYSCHDFTNTPLARSLNSNWQKQPGCHSQPFFNIKLENVIIDELHLMLRVTDRLEDGLIRDIVSWDEVTNKVISCNNNNCESQTQTQSSFMIYIY